MNVTNLGNNGIKIFGIFIELRWTHQFSLFLVYQFETYSLARRFHSNILLFNLVSQLDSLIQKLNSWLTLNKKIARDKEKKWSVDPIIRCVSNSCSNFFFFGGKEVPFLQPTTSRYSLSLWTSSTKITQRVVQVQ